MKKYMDTIGGLYNDVYYIIKMQFNNSKMTTCFVRKPGLLPKATKKISNVCSKTNIPHILSADEWMQFR